MGWGPPEDDSHLFDDEEEYEAAEQELEEDDEVEGEITPEMIQTRVYQNREYAADMKAEHQMDRAEDFDPGDEVPY